MPSTFTTNKNIEKPASGSYNNAWAAPVNQDWDDIDNALGGTASINVTGVGAGTYALTVAQYQPPNIEFIGTLTAALTYVIPPGVGGIWTIANGTIGAFSLIFGVSGGGAIVIPVGAGFGRSIVTSDGNSVTFADSAQIYAAELYANSVANTAQANAQAFATAADTTVLSTAETFATNAANTAQTNAENFTTSQLTAYAPLASPALTGVPTAPTAAGGTNSTQLATTAYALGAANTAQTNAENFTTTQGYVVATSGTFTATYNGASGATGTAQYRTVGNIVVIVFPAVTGTGNGTSLTISGLPGAIQPTRTQWHPIGGSIVENNGVTPASNTFTMILSAGSGTVTVVPDSGVPAFGGAGARGFSQPYVVTYMLN